MRFSPTLFSKAMPAVVHTLKYQITQLNNKIYTTAPKRVNMTL